MSSVPFKQVDVFTSKRFKGNPVAVVMDASELSTEQMQNIASWTNLSETTFVLPTVDAAADYRVRIFTPGSELPFAGHPTIGTAHALLEAGIISVTNGRLLQECGAGLITLNVSKMENGERSISFELPEPKITLLSREQVSRLENILGCSINYELTPALVDVGARWIVVCTADAKTVLATQPDFSRLKDHDIEMNCTGICIYGSYPEGMDAHIEVRSFAPACGVNEDPVCGSGNGSVAAFMRHHNVMAPEGVVVTSSQGVKLGREGLLSLVQHGGKIFVGGSAVTCIEGTIAF
ncbi:MULTISPECIES: PhzF family phenazine biosynthesis protein [Photorhabdus]|uniref:Phenazine biosynthesis protein, phzf family n=2 Tax=Photorhabdus asymbiotica TaxID=291112 RepID=C7BK74_PHOAA|nr:PhzF family phenazine biosynthesis protein [Photorhabdus asymbiotica]RKS65801.1 PhzF family phenazine biosynthesis protein [Photorhabdus asymbiotica]CAQ84314.1 phenazine biosynthesis protein, phzf family [Photorhabdus asymbiotica]